MRLEPDNTWAYVQQLSTNTGTKADVKQVGDVVHIVMHNSGSSLLSLQYVAASKTYQPWSARPTHTPLALGETGTIDIDSTGRMWLATESAVGILAFYSDFPYSAFTGPVVIANDVDSDDIGAVVALPNNTIGIFWSNQATKLFGFKYHDGWRPTQRSGRVMRLPAPLAPWTATASDWPKITSTWRPRQTGRCLPPSKRDTPL